MWPLPIRELFFVGGAAQRKMENLGLHTIGQLAVLQPEVLKSHLGEKYAVLIRQYANGIDDDPVAEKEPVNKAVATASPFPGIYLTMKAPARSCSPSVKP
ncbi:MAG: DNA polymerase thumb domain-containing protein [Enterocloster clostridioformis]